MDDVIAEIRMNKEKETKNTIRYKEVCKSNEKPILATIYVSKFKLGAIYKDAPQTLKVVVSTGY
jgi:hypothetical protein